MPHEVRMADNDAPPVERLDSAVEDANGGAPGGKPDSVPDVAKLTEQLATLEKRFHDTQAAFTQKSQEAAVAKAEAALLKSQQDRGISAEAAAKEQEAFDAKWRADLAEDPGKAVDFLRGTMREARDSLKALQEQALEQVRAELRELREAQNPEYQQNREAVDELMKEFPGLSRGDAAKLVKKMAVPRTTATPPRAQIPGRAGGGAGAGVDDPPPPEVEVPALVKATWDLLGLSAEDRKTITKQPRK